MDWTWIWCFVKQEMWGIFSNTLHSWLVQIHQQRYFLKNGPKVMITNPLDRQKFNIPYLTHPQYECPKKKHQRWSVLQQMQPDAVWVLQQGTTLQRVLQFLRIFGQPKEQILQESAIQKPWWTRTNSCARDANQKVMGDESALWWGFVQIVIFRCKWNLLVTLWLCQNSYWKWPLIVNFPIKNGDFP